MASTDASTPTQHPDYPRHIHALERAKVGLFTNAYWNFDQKTGNIAQFRKVCDRVIADVHRRGVAGTLKDSPLVAQEFINTLLLPESEVKGDDDPRFATSPITPVQGPAQMTKSISRHFTDPDMRLENVNYMDSGSNRMWVTTHAQRGAMFFHGRVFAHLKCGSPYMWTYNEDRTEAYTALSNDPDLWSLLDKPTEGNERKSYLVLIVLLDAIDAILDGLNTMASYSNNETPPLSERLVGFETTMLTGHWEPITLDEQMEIWHPGWNKGAVKSDDCDARESNDARDADKSDDDRDAEKSDDDRDAEESEDNVDDATSHDGDK